MALSKDAPESINFDSESIATERSFDSYRVLYAIGADVVQIGPHPRAKFVGWRLDRALLYDRNLNDISHRRDTQRVRTDKFTHWTVTLLISGSLQVDFGGGIQNIKPGEVILLDVSQPYRNRMQDARIITLAIAHDRIERTIGQFPDVHGLILGADGCKLYAEFVKSLLINLPNMKTSTLPSATSALCTLIRVALDQNSEGDVLLDISRDGVRLSQFRTLVDGRIVDPSFGVERAILESGISRATLYRLLRPYNGLSEFIKMRRLEHIRRALSKPADDRAFSIIALSAGFNSESFASRAFLAHYGMRPGNYRHTITSSSTKGDPMHQFKLWQQELR